MTSKNQPNRGRRAYDRPVLRAAVLLATTSLVVVLPAGSSDAAASKSVTIRVFATPVMQSITNDVPPHTARLLGRFTKGDTVAEMAILRNVVPQFGKPKGWNVGTCSTVILEVSGPTVREDSVARFPGGSVHVRGERKAVPHWKLPIVGGTGIYAGATGVVESRLLVTSAPAGDWLNIYRLQIP
jgi:hypothetical protein